MAITITLLLVALLCWWIFRKFTQLFDEDSFNMESIRITDSAIISQIKGKENKMAYSTTYVTEPKLASTEERRLDPFQISNSFHVRIHDLSGIPARITIDPKLEKIKYLTNGKKERVEEVLKNEKYMALWKEMMNHFFTTDGYIYGVIKGQEFYIYDVLTNSNWFTYDDLLQIFNEELKDFGGNVLPYIKAGTFKSAEIIETYLDAMKAEPKKCGKFYTLPYYELIGAPNYDYQGEMEFHGLVHNGTFDVELYAKPYEYKGPVGGGAYNGFRGEYDEYGAEWYGGGGYGGGVEQCYWDAKKGEYVYYDDLKKKDKKPSEAGGATVNGGDTPTDVLPVTNQSDCVDLTSDLQLPNVDVLLQGAARQSVEVLNSPLVILKKSEREEAFKATHKNVMAYLTRKEKVPTKEEIKAITVICYLYAIYTNHYTRSCLYAWLNKPENSHHFQGIMTDKIMGYAKMFVSLWFDKCQANIDRLNKEAAALINSEYVARVLLEEFAYFDELFMKEFFQKTSDQVIAPKQVIIASAEGGVKELEVV